MRAKLAAVGAIGAPGVMLVLATKSITELEAAQAYYVKNPSAEQCPPHLTWRIQQFLRKHTPVSLQIEYQREELPG